MKRNYSTAARLFNRQALFATELARLSPEQATGWREVARAARESVWPEDQLFTIEQIDKAFFLQEALENEFTANGADVDKTLKYLRDLLE